MIHQIQYRFKTKPTGDQIRAARTAFISGKKANCRIAAVNWSRTAGNTRLAASTGYVGRAGLVKCYARPDWTMCDFDSAKAPSLESVWRLAKMIDVFPLWIRLDRTRRGWHLIIQWNRRFRPIEIVAIQAVLGSDLKRETFNLARVFSGKARNRRWNLLFERKLT